MTRIPREEKLALIISKTAEYLRIIAKNPGITNNGVDALSKHIGATSAKYLMQMQSAGLIRNEKETIRPGQIINHWHVCDAITKPHHLHLVRHSPEWLRA